jgi:type I restriction enzyme S subunit
MKQYKNYKSSKSKIILNIPEHWLERKIKDLFKIGRGRVISEQELKDNGLYPVFSSQTKNNGCLGYIDTFDFDCTILTWTTDGANAGSVFLRNGKFNCTNVCGTLDPKNELSLGFYLFYLQFITRFYKRQDTNGAKIMNNEMGNIYCLIPPLTEQIQIASFLDKKTALIDEIIAKKERLIETLQAKRQATINEAVHGKKVWDSKSKTWKEATNLKDSGIDWLGEIPADNKIIRLRFLGECQNGVSAGSEYFGSGDPFVSYSDVYKNIQLPNKFNGLANSTESDKKNYSVEEGDVFFTRTSETIEEIGIASTCFETIPNAVFAGFLIRFRPHKNSIYKGFSKYFFRSRIPRIHFVKEMNLVTRASLSQELLKSLPVVLPPFEIQKIISKYLEIESENYDKIINKLSTQIQKLKDYRQSLISEAVTGKIDVSDCSGKID